MQDLLELRKVVADLFGVKPQDVAIGQEKGGPPSSLLATVSGFRLAISWVRTSEPGLLMMEWPHVQERTRSMSKTAVPLLAVPFMGAGGQECCEKGGIGWMDLCGNARVSGPGLRLLVTGQPNRFARRGRPSSAFAPRSACVVRALLEQPAIYVSQRELSRIAGINEGSASRVVRKLEDDGYLVREDDGKVRPKDAALLLRAWDHAHSMLENHILRGHAPSSCGASLLHDIARFLEQTSVDYAATGLAGAWAWDAVSDFRTVTLYLRKSPPLELLDALQSKHHMAFQDIDDDAANIWFVVPKDDGMFQGVVKRKGLHTADRLQVFLDLAAHKEEANAAREILRPKITENAGLWELDTVRIHSPLVPKLRDYWTDLMGKHEILHAPVLVRSAAAQDMTANQKCPLNQPARGTRDAKAGKT